MTDVLVYSRNGPPICKIGHTPRWHSSHRALGDLMPGDRLWVITSGKALGRADPSAGYLVGVWSVASVIENPGDDPDYPAQKYQHRLLINETEALHLDEPICVDHVIRGDGYDREIPIGRFLRGPRRLSDEKLRQLRTAVGAELARKWLTASKPKPGDSNATLEGEKKGSTERRAS
jgi:hypothetical protein